jgi:hypothetical protein
MPKNNQSVSREFLAERDLRIFKMRQAGVPSNEIARRFGMTTTAVGTSVKRQLEKLNKEALLAYPEVLRMELERLDALQQAIWPLTQYRKIKADDGTELQIEPDLKAVQTLLSIIDRRSRLLGMEQNNINVQMDVQQSSAVRSTLAGAIPRTAADQFSPEAEARKLLEIMGDSGVLTKEYIDGILRKSGELESADDADTEIDESPLATSNYNGPEILGLPAAGETEVE